MKVSKYTIRDNEAWITVRSESNPSEYVIVHISGKVRSVDQPSETNIELRVGLFRDSYYTEGYKLSLIQKISLKLCGRVEVFKKVIASGAIMPFYAFVCSDHGIVISPASGYSDTLHCPYCPLFNGQMINAYDCQKIKVS